MLEFALALLIQDVGKKDQTEAWLDQIAAGLKLYAEFNGGYPEKLENLAVQPKDVKLWPDGGYLLVAEIPRDPWGRAFVYDGKTVKSLGPDEKSDADDVSETLGKMPASKAADVYELTRIARLALLQAAVLARRRQAHTLPESMKDFIGSPYVVADEKQLRGKSGELSLKGSKDGVRLTFTAKPPKPDPCTDEDRQRFEGFVKDLASDDIDVRDRASKGIVDMESKALELLKDRKEADPEVAGRLSVAEKEIRRVLAPKVAVFETVAFVFPAPGVSIVPGMQGAKMAANERNAATCLKCLVTAEENLKGNDVDRNGVGDYWTADLRGLYCIKMTSSGKPTACLSDLGMVYADTSPVPAKKFEGIDMDGDGNPDTAYDASEFAAYLEIPKPKAGYLFKVIPFNDRGQPYAQNTDNTGDSHNWGEYGFCAYPSEYGATGTYTFIVNNVASVFRKDLRGRPLERWPTDEELKDWAKVE